MLVKKANEMNLDVEIDNKNSAWIQADFQISIIEKINY